MTNDAARKQDSEAVRQAQILLTAFSTPAGIEALRIILDICGHGKTLPRHPNHGLTGDNALYFGGRKDVAEEILLKMNFKPADANVTVKTKRD